MGIDKHGAHPQGAWKERELSHLLNLSGSEGITGATENGKWLMGVIFFLFF